MSRLSAYLNGGSAGQGGRLKSRDGIGDVRFTNFFDSDKVRREVDAADRRVLNHAGATGRKIAKRSIRKRKKVSEPGRPPNSHAGWLRKFIYYQYNPVHASVIIGPAKLSTADNYSVPEILEFGGDVTIYRKNKRLRQRFQARPYMQPALEETARRFPELWQGAIGSTF